MAKKVKIMECCVLTKDDKGNLSLVGKAKEAITAFQKKNIAVTIALTDTSKEDAEKFLNDNNVTGCSFKELPKDDETFDICVVGGSNIIQHHSDWRWTAEDVVRRLYDKKPDAPVSEQKKMDDSLSEIIKLTKERNKKRADGEVIAYDY